MSTNRKVKSKYKGHTVVRAEHGTEFGGALADGSVTNPKIADGSITADKIAEGAVIPTKVADNSIDSNHYVDGSVDGVHIADNSIGTNHLGVDVILAEDIANNAVTVAELADNAVTAAKISSTDPQFCVDGSGQVGIGTASPKTALTIANGNVTDPGKWASSALAIENSTHVGSHSQIGFGYLEGTDNAAAYIGFVSTQQGTNGKGDLIMGSRDEITDTQPTEKMRITSDGKVGIGTDSPSTALEVKGTVSLDDDGQTKGMWFGDISSSQAKGYVGGGDFAINSAATNDFGVSASDGNNLLFGVNGSEKMRITPAGDVGIGTTSPDSTLEVNDLADAKISVVRSNAGGNVGGLELKSVGGTGINERSGNIELRLPHGGTGDPGLMFSTTNDSDVKDTMYIEHGKVGINTEIVDGVPVSPKSPLEVSSVTGGVIMPRMTTAQMNAISSPTNGEMIYNTSENKFYGRAAGAWTALH